MAGAHAQGATFTFAGITAQVVSVSVDYGTPEIVDMTGLAKNGLCAHAFTGDMASPGAITVEVLTGGSVSTALGRRDFVSFTSSGFSVQRNAILESWTAEARVGDIVRSTLRFRLTDHYG